MFIRPATHMPISMARKGRFPVTGPQCRTSWKAIPNPPRLAYRIPGVFCQHDAGDIALTTPEEKRARLTINEGGVERDEEADWGEKHLDGPNEVFL